LIDSFTASPGRYRKPTFCKILIDNIGVRTRVLISQLPNGETYYIPKFQPKILKFEKVIAIFENQNFYGAVKKSIDQ